MGGIEHVTWDKTANAAYIAFAQNTGGDRHAVTTLPVLNNDGTALVGALDFGADGELIGVELLNAQVQLGGALKRAAQVSG